MNQRISVGSAFFAFFVGAHAEPRQASFRMNCVVSGNNRMISQFLLHISPPGKLDSIVITRSLCGPDPSILCFFRRQSFIGQHGACTGFQAHARCALRCARVQCELLIIVRAPWPKRSCVADRSKHGWHWLLSDPLTPPPLLLDVVDHDGLGRAV